jgi:archaellin
MNINTKFNIDDKVYTIDFEQKKLMVGYIEKINIVVEQHSGVSRAIINMKSVQIFIMKTDCLQVLMKHVHL